MCARRRHGRPSETGIGDGLIGEGGTITGIRRLATEDPLLVVAVAAGGAGQCDTEEGAVHRLLEPRQRVGVGDVRRPPQGESRPCELQRGVTPGQHLDRFAEVAGAGRCGQLAARLSWGARPPPEWRPRRRPAIRSVDV